MNKRNTMRMLLGKSSSGRTKQAKPKKPHRPLREVLAGAAVWALLDLLESKWNKDLWNPKD